MPIDKVGKGKGLKHAHLSFRHWHTGHNIQAVPGFGGIGVKLVCLDCGLIADAEAIGEFLSDEGVRDPARKVKP